MAQSECEMSEMEYDSEYTLEDAFGDLKDAALEEREVKDDLTALLRKKCTIAASQMGDAEEIRKKQQKLSYCLTKRIREMRPKYYCYPGTPGLHIEVVTDLEEEIRNVLAFYKNMEERLSDIKNDVSYLEEKKLGFVKMKEAGLNAMNLIKNSNYSEESREMKRVFKTTKKDLHFVVETLFPNNENFSHFLQKLTMQYTKDEEDSYVDIEPEVMNVINFLLESEIIAYHPQDKTKVRLMDLV